MPVPPTRVTRSGVAFHAPSRKPLEESPAPPPVQSPLPSQTQHPVPRGSRDYCLGPCWEDMCGETSGGRQVWGDTCGKTRVGRHVGKSRGKEEMAEERQCTTGWFVLEYNNMDMTVTHSTYTTPHTHTHTHTHIATHTSSTDALRQRRPDLPLFTFSPPLSPFSPLSPRTPTPERPVLILRVRLNKLCD